MGNSKNKALRGLFVLAPAFCLLAPGAQAATGAVGAVGAPGASVVSGGGVPVGGGAPVGGGGAFGGGTSTFVIPGAGAPLGGGGPAFGGGGPALGGGPTPGGGVAFGSNPATNQAITNALSNSNFLINPNNLNTLTNSGAAFGNVINPGVLSGISNRVFVPGFGGGIWGGWGGGPTIINQGFAAPMYVPPPIPAQSLGPIQINTASPFAYPEVTSTRQVFVNGMPTVVTSPMVTNYRWPSGSKLARARSSSSFARIFRSTRRTLSKRFCRRGNRACAGS